MRSSVFEHQRINTSSTLQIPSTASVRSSRSAVNALMLGTLNLGEMRQTSGQVSSSLCKHQILIIHKVVPTLSERLCNFPSASVLALALAPALLLLTLLVVLMLMLMLMLKSIAHA